MAQSGQIMDALSSVLSRVTLRAGVFYTGNICGFHDFDSDTQKGHLHLIQRGPVVLRMHGQADCTIHEPTLLFLPQPPWHRLLADEASGADVVCGSIALGGGVHNPVSASLPSVVQVPLAAMPAQGALLTLMFEEAFQDRTGRQAILDRLCEVLMVQLLRHFMEQGLASRGVLAGLADVQLNKVLRAIHDDPAKPWDLPSMASLAGMSRASFAEYFKRVLGQPPAQYLGQWRIQSAQHQLQQGLSIQQTAHAVGYGSASALTRAFVRELGAPPGVWLKGDHRLHP